MVSLRETYAFDLRLAREAAGRRHERQRRYGEFTGRAQCREYSKLDRKERLAKRANRLLNRLNRMAPERAAQLIEAQWQGAFNQWGFFREGSLPDFVRQSLEAWFDLAERR